MVKVKNVRPGILIIADAGLKLGPGEVVSAADITPQMERAVDAGLLALVEAEPEVKQKIKAPAKSHEQPSDTEEKPGVKEPTVETKPDLQSAKSEPGVKNGAG